MRVQHMLNSIACNAGAASPATQRLLTGRIQSAQLLAAPSDNECVTVIGDLALPVVQGAVCKHVSHVLDPGETARRLTGLDSGQMVKNPLGCLADILLARSDSLVLAALLVNAKFLKKI